MEYSLAGVPLSLDTLYGRKRLDDGHLLISSRRKGLLSTEDMSISKSYTRISLART